MLTAFFYPYFLLIYGASLNVQQSLEGLGVSSPSPVKNDGGGHVMVSFLSPGHALLPIMGLLLVLACSLFWSIALAGYVLRRKTGAALAMLLLCLPGILNLMSLWPALPLIPDSFVIGGNGMLGSGWGIVPLLVMGLLAGWSGLILFSDLLRLGENFGHLYDHVWCLSGVIAAVFFVADSQVGEHARDLQDSVRVVQQASTYLSRQALAYDHWCITSRQQNSVSCSWAANVQQKLLDYSTRGAKLYREFGPQAPTDVYSVYGRKIASAEVTAIRTEIEAYNAAICPVTQLGPGVWRRTQSARCLRTPAAYCTAYPDPLHGTINKNLMIETSAFSNECIVSTLVALRARQEKLLDKVDQDLSARRYRWMYYLLFSVVVGGKIATATVKLSAMHRRATDDSRRSLYLARRIWSLALRLSRFFFRATTQCLASSWLRMRQARGYFLQMIRRRFQRK